MRRRLLPGFLALLVLTGLLLVLPVLSAPRPQPVPVRAVAAELPMAPAGTPAPGEAAPAAGTATAPAAIPAPSGVAAAATAPVLTVTRTQVHPFSMVGVTWAFDPAVKDTVVRVRVQNAKGSWGHWTEIAAEDAVPNESAATRKKERGGTAPLWTGPSSGVQAELTTRSGARPADVKLDLIDPGVSKADSALGRPAIRDTAHAASSMPPVFSRAQWGADETIRTWGPQMAGTIKAATIHHSADSNDYTADQVPALMRAIYRYHAVSLGWGDIGYNVVVDKFGRMWEGRYGGLASTVIGAHAGGFNTYTFGVSMLGNYDLVDVPPAVISAVASIISWKFSLYDVNPLGTTTLISAGGGTDKYAPGVPVTLPTIFAHRDVGATICPGRYGYARMGQIRNLVAGTVVDVSQISTRYDSDPALQAVLGPQTAAPALTADGSGGFATYQNGALYYSRATGVRMVQGPIRDRWVSAGAEAGILGYPTSDVAPTPDGLWQYATFQHGSIYWSSSTGARAVTGPIDTLWRARGAEHGALGYPTSEVTATAAGGGQYATFEHGSIYWTSRTGAQVMYGPVEALWNSQGAEQGWLGLPTVGVTPTADGVGRFARFQGGSVFWSPSTGAHSVTGAIGGMWTAIGSERGLLGYPTADEAGSDGVGRFSRFEHGSIYWTAATGPRVMLGAVEAAWDAAGAERGFLGYPTQSVSWAGDHVGQYARFQRGVIFWSPSSGAHQVLGAIGALWAAGGAEHGVLGYPVTDELVTADGVGRVSRFQHGSIYWSPTTGAHALLGPIGSFWDAIGAEHGLLGYPTQSVSNLSGGQFARFQHGSIYWTPATGTRVLLGAIERRWLADGAQAGRMGFPIQSVSNLAGGQYARFQGGSIYWSPSSGAWEVRGSFLAAWAAVGAEHGALGYPIGEPYAVNGGQWQRFQHGYVAHSTATGRTWAVRR